MESPLPQPTCSPSKNQIKSNQNQKDLWELERISSPLMHLELGRQWKGITFHMFCMDRKVCIIFI
jgi:hypothetical protein